MAALTCLDNLIGIKGECGTPTDPTSGLYVQDLPFVTLKNADAGMSEDMTSGFELIQNKLSFAHAIIANDIRNFFSSKIKIPTIIENDVIGFFNDNLDTVVAEAGKYKGIHIRIDEYPFLEFFVSSITLQWATAVATNVYVYDLISGTLIDTLPISTVANTPTQIIVNKAYRTNKQKINLMFVTDAGAGTAIKTTTTRTGTISGCSTCGHSLGRFNQYVWANGAQISAVLTKIDSNVKTNDGTNGMSMLYSLNCTLDPFICTISNQLAFPILYKFGSELMKEFKRSRRLNSVVTIHSKDIDELQSEYEGEYRERMNLLLNNAELPDDICFYCQPRIKTIVRIP